MKYLKLFESFEDGVKYLRLFESFEDIEWICRRYNIIDYTINSDGTVDVNGTVYLKSSLLREIPIQFGAVGSFYCNHNLLTSLEGCPKEVKGDFFCENNKLTSLEGCPEKNRWTF